MEERSMYDVTINIKVNEDQDISSVADWLSVILEECPYIDKVEIIY